MASKLDKQGDKFYGIRTFPLDIFPRTFSLPGQAITPILFTWCMIFRLPPPPFANKVIYP